MDKLSRSNLKSHELIHAQHYQLHQISSLSDPTKSCVYSVFICDIPSTLSFTRSTAINQRIMFPLPRISHSSRHVQAIHPIPKKACIDPLSNDQTSTWVDFICHQQKRGLHSTEQTPCHSSWTSTRAVRSTGMCFREAWGAGMTLLCDVGVVKTDGLLRSAFDCLRFACPGRCSTFSSP